MPKKIDPEVKDRAVRLVNEHLKDYSSVTAASEAVAKQLGVGRETVRRWVVQADVDGGARPGVTRSKGHPVVETRLPGRGTLTVHVAVGASVAAGAAGVRLPALRCTVLAVER